MELKHGEILLRGKNECPILSTFKYSNSYDRCTRCGKGKVIPSVRKFDSKRKPMDFLCIPCKNSARQKQKENWFNSLPTPSKAGSMPYLKRIEGKERIFAEKVEIEEKNFAEKVKIVDGNLANKVEIRRKNCAGEVEIEGKYLSNKIVTEENIENNERILSLANKVLIARLECPVCYQLMSPPLRQCKSGHCICSNCSIKLNRCPTCRQGFIDTTNVVLNEICLVLVVPCRFYELGCRQLVRLADKSKHEKECQWRLYNCPENSKCEWKGLQIDLVDHVIKTHSGTVSRIVVGQYCSLRYTYGPVSPIEETGSEGSSFSVVSRTFILVNEFGQGLEVFVFCLKYDTGRGSLCGVVRFVGSKIDASSYSYKIKLVSPDKKFKVTTTSVCVGYDENVGNVIADGAIMKLDARTFKIFVNKEGKFFVSIKIFMRGAETEK